MSNSVKIRKKNRILHVESDRLEGFLNQGYDQIDEDGNVVKRATGGRTVSLPEYNKVLEELEALRAIDPSAELETANKEIKSLKEKVKELEDASKKAEAPKK